MALKTLIPFPIFAPIPTATTPITSAPTTTELRFSRWNNANAEKFNQQRRTQQRIEDDLRRHRRFDSALNIANFEDSPAPNFKSTGTPSKPSLSSIPGKKSKYSKTQNPDSHPAFRRVPRKTKLPQKETVREELGEASLKIGEDGLSYVVSGAPFEFMYSYTETPKVKPLALREPPVVPFGLPRPWTGRKPFPPSKKKLPEFDSFTPPPPNKKGVKPVQKPGPFLPGSGPKYVMSREEVLGEPLTDEEVKELIEGCRKSDRQLNMGRDGLTHNMLDNIHAHWKRRRVCKIKCKGVCTVDMDNVRQQLEEKTGGKIIYHRGGIVYLFRGRNYNYKTRPRFPLMLWKPVTPVYPRLIQRIPEGLTLEEATDMRKRGRELTPICKLGKNGVYVYLVKNVREAFEACELVRIDCQGLNPSDYRKIGAKLKDLVPCVLISYEKEHILMWRGRDWKPSILLPEDGNTNVKTLVSSNKLHSLASDNREECSSSSSNNSIQGTSVEIPNISTVLDDDSDLCIGISSEVEDVMSTSDNSSSDETKMMDDFSDEKESSSVSTLSEYIAGGDSIDDLKEETLQESNSSPLDSPCLEGVVGLLRQAVEDGSAVVLDNSSLDADLIYQRSAAFAQIAPAGPVFRHHPRKVAVQKAEKKEAQNLDVDEAEAVANVPVPENKPKEKKSKGKKNIRTLKPQDFKDDYLNIVPQGSLKVDELAKLLA